MRESNDVYYIFVRTEVFDIMAKDTKTNAMRKLDSMKIDYKEHYYTDSGAVAGVDPITLLILSLIAVVAWLLIGTYGTKMAIEYADYIEIIGGVAIILLGIQAMLESFGIII